MSNIAERAVTENENLPGDDNSSSVSQPQKSGKCARPGHIDLHEPSRDVEIKSGDTASEDEDALRGEDADSVIRVSIGKEQTRLTSATTPATEKSAALDRKNSWGFFDDVTQDEQEEVMRNTIYNAAPPELESPEMEESPSRDAERGSKHLPLPSPWTSGPRPFSQEETSRFSNWTSPSRSRASSASITGDGSIKRFFAGLSFPSMPEPKVLREMTKLAPGLNPRSSQEAGDRHAGSSSLRLAWGGSQGGQGLRTWSRDASPGQKTSAGNESPSSNLGGYDGTSRRMPRISEHASRQVSQLRRSASDDSMMRHALSRTSTLEGDHDWDTVSSQVNSRMKAIKDSLHDSLPNMPSLNLNSLRHEFALKWGNDSESTGQNAMSGVYRTASSTTRSRQGSTGSLRGSPSRLTRPKFPTLDSALELLIGDVVVLGGYRGSILRSAEPPNRQLWVPVKVGLNIRKVNLEVGLNPEDDETMEKSIFSSGMLTHIGPVDMSRRLLKKLRNCKNAKDGKLRVHDYGYDWRLSPHYLSRRLIKFLEGLECNEPGAQGHCNGATVIAHSLGGLITRHAVNKRPELFAGVLNAGVPQHCVNILGPLRNGDEVLFSSRVLTAQVNFTFRTSFLLLPESGQCFVDKFTKEQYPVDFFDVNSWSKYALSPCISPSLPALTQPERKGIFSSITDSISGSFSSNSIPGSKPESSTEHTIAHKADDLVNPENHTLNLQMEASPPISIACTLPITEATAYLKRTLSEVSAFKKELVHNQTHQDANAYPPLSLMYSTGTPTVFGARVSGRDGINRADAYENLVFAAGDGVVLARAAMLPKKYQIADGGKVRTDRGHVGMLADLEAVGKCLIAMRKARMQGVGLGAPGESEGLV